MHVRSPDSCVQSKEEAKQSNNNDDCTCLLSPPRTPAFCRAAKPRQCCRYKTLAYNPLSLPTMLLLLLPAQTEPLPSTGLAVPAIGVAAVLTAAPVVT